MAHGQAHSLSSDKISHQIPLGGAEQHSSDADPFEDGSQEKAVMFAIDIHL